MKKKKQHKTELQLREFDNTILLENLRFFGEQFAPSDHITGSFHQGIVCRFLAINQSNLSNWKHNIKPVARTTIIRMADKLSQYFAVHITPEMLVSRSISDVIDLATFTPDIEQNTNGIDEKLQHLLNKYPEMKRPILLQLQLYDKK